MKIIRPITMTPIFAACLVLAAYCTGYALLRTTHVFTHFNSWDMPTYHDASESYHIVDVYGWSDWRDKSLFTNALRVVYWPARTSEALLHRWNDPKGAHFRT